MTHIKQRRDLSAVWASVNPVLHLGEVGWETDTRRAKLGNGTDPWNDLPYVIDSWDDIPGLYAALSAKASLVSPTFTGDPKAPTPASSDNDTSIATTAFVKTVLAPALGGYAPLNTPVFVGEPTAPTPVSGDNSKKLATTEFVKAQGYATLASPTFTGDPKAPTPSTADNDTSIATTAFVKAQGYAPLASPGLTGSPTAPTPPSGNSSTRLATTSWAQEKMADSGRIIVGSGGSAPAYGSGMADANTGVDYRTWFRKVGPFVTVNIAITKSAAGTFIFTLPTGYRPPAPIWTALAGSAVPGANQMFAVFPSGDVGLGTSLANGAYYGSVMFAV